MSKRKVLFLDIDGVLNTERHYEYCCKNHVASDERFGYPFDPEAVANLKKNIDEIGAEIVISSSWKFWGLSTMIDLWKRRNLPGKVIGITPQAMSDEMLQNADLTKMEMLPLKGSEIKGWLSEHKRNVAQYAILDDVNDMLPEQQSHFVQINPIVGITEQDAEEVIAILTKPIAEV